VAKESVRVGFEYFKANVKNVSSTLHAGEFDYHVHVVDLQGSGPTAELSLVTFVSLCSVLLGKSIQDQMVILGQMTLGGAVERVTPLADSLQAAHEAGAKRILLPMSSAADLSNVPPELFAKFQSAFYSSPVDAVFKALGVV
jgi:ATP-dependent Lon protease